MPRRITGRDLYEALTDGWSEMKPEKTEENRYHSFEFFPSSSPPAWAFLPEYEKKALELAADIVDGIGVGDPDRSWPGESGG